MPRVNTTTVTPGAEGDKPEAGDEQGLKPPVDDKDARIAELEAKLAAQEAESKLPKVVYEPVTPHGAAALAASDYAGMTVAELMAMIDAGRAKEPMTSVLCADGWYARRS